MKIKPLINSMILFYLGLIVLVSFGIYSLVIHSNQIDDIHKANIKGLLKYSSENVTSFDIEHFKSAKNEIMILKEGIDLSLIFIYIIMSIAAFSLIFISRVIRNKILHPISQMNKTISLYKNGEKNIKEIEYNDDEIGFMIKEFFVMKKKLDDDYFALEKLALTDPLTEILNRRAFFEVSEELLKLSIRNKSTFSILILDIDFFKKVNDVYGHLIGDDILKFLVTNVKTEIRDSDVFARFGGEEFIILLPDTNEDGAFSLADKIRICIENNPYEDEKLSVPITVSIGVSQLQGEKLLRELIHRADEALYKAKEMGRNQVVIG